jgi:DNA end-binding protein Ku
VFAPRDSVEWIWLDTPYYLSPDDPVGEEAFSVIRDAMAAEDMVGIWRLASPGASARSCSSRGARHCGMDSALWRRGEGRGCLFRRDRRQAVGFKGHAACPAVDQEADPPLGQQLVFDPIQDKLLEIIEAKRKKTKRLAKEKASEPEATPTNVVNIMDALRRSVEAEKRPGKR